MKWVTREHVKIDRVACPWLIKNFIDPQAEFLFVESGLVMEVAQSHGAIPYDIPDVELGHHFGKCSFEAIIDKYEITDPAILILAEIVHGADVSVDLYGRKESIGLKAIATGFAKLGLKNDQEILDREFVVYDALYAYCKDLVSKV